MNCEKWKGKILCMHYDELDEEQILEVRKHLRECDKCAQFQEEIQSTTKLLDQWKSSGGLVDHPVPADLDELHERIRSSSFGTKLSAKWRWAGAAVVSIIALIVLTFNLLGTEIRWQDGTLTVRFASTEKSEPQVDQTELIKHLAAQQQVFMQFSSELESALNEIVSIMQSDQERQDTELRTLAEISQAQRQFDHAQIREAMGILVEEMDSRTTYTQAALNWLINNQAQIEEIK